MNAHKNAVIVGHRKTWATSVTDIIDRVSLGLPTTTMQSRPAQAKKIGYPAMLKLILIMFVISNAVIVVLSSLALGCKKLTTMVPTLPALLIMILLTSLAAVGLSRLVMIILT